MAAPVVIAPNGLSVTLKDEVEKRGLDRAFDKSNYVYKLDREALDSGLEPKGPNDVSTILHYIDEAKSDKTPYITPVKGKVQKQINKVYIPMRTVVTDVTGQEDQFNLNNNGFQFAKLDVDGKPFVTTEASVAEEVWFPAVAEMLKKITGASKVHMFGCVFRVSLTEEKPTRPTGFPAFHIHCDQSYRGGHAVLEDRLPDIVNPEEIKGKRFQVINVWKGLNTVHKHPFAVVDGVTIEEEDLVPAPVYLPRGILGEGWDVKPNPKHRWYYKHEMTTSDVVLFKCFDSDERAKVRRLPHTAFIDERYEVDYPKRESLEVRAICFFDN